MTNKLHISMDGVCMKSAVGDVRGRVNIGLIKIPTDVGNMIYRS
jgi:hypothetical protein